MSIIRTYAVHARYISMLYLLSSASLQMSIVRPRWRLIRGPQNTPPSGSGFIGLRSHLHPVSWLWCCAPRSFWLLSTDSELDDSDCHPPWSDVTDLRNAVVAGRVLASAFSSTADLAMSHHFVSRSQISRKINGVDSRRKTQCVTPPVLSWSRPTLRPTTLRALMHNHTSNYRRIFALTIVKTACAMTSETSPASPRHRYLPNHCMQIRLFLQKKVWGKLR